MTDIIGEPSPEPVAKLGYIEDDKDCQLITLPIISDNFPGLVHASTTTTALITDLSLELGMNPNAVVPAFEEACNCIQGFYSIPGEVLKLIKPIILQINTFKVLVSDYMDLTMNPHKINPFLFTVLLHTTTYNEQIAGYMKDRLPVIFLSAVGEPENFREKYLRHLPDIGYLWVVKNPRFTKFDKIRTYLTLPDALQRVRDLENGITQTLE